MKEYVMKILAEEKIMEEVRSPRLPTRLKNNPLVGVLFELRFTSSLPLTNILPGIIFSELGCSDIEKTPHADIPESIKSQNEDLAHLPTVKMLWNDYLILMSDRILIIECRLPYKGWGDFKEKILKLLSVIKESRMDINVNRYSLKYIDIVNANEHEKINNTLKLNFSFGGADLNLASTQIRTETTIADAAVIINLAGTARAEFENGSTKEGFLIDTDTLYNINGKKLTELLPEFPDKLTELHDINKGLFFSYLTDAGLEELEPEYD